MGRHSSSVDRRTATKVNTMNHHNVLEVRCMYVERSVRRKYKLATQSFRHHWLFMTVLATFYIMVEASSQKCIA
jgi:hypothetical protein